MGGTAVNGTTGPISKFNSCLLRGGNPSFTYNTPMARHRPRLPHQAATSMGNGNGCPQPSWTSTSWRDGDECQLRDNAWFAYSYRSGRRARARRPRRTLLRRRGAAVTPLQNWLNDMSQHTQRQASHSSSRLHSQNVHNAALDGAKVVQQLGDQPAAVHDLELCDGIPALADDSLHELLGSIRVRYNAREADNGGSRHLLFIPS